MTDILARWKGESFDHNQAERKAEREWAWVLTRFQIGDVLEDQTLTRSIASHWGKFSADLSPSTFFLKDIPDMGSAFISYLLAKKKDYPSHEIACFLAWKFWEAKIQSWNIFSPEIHPATVAWQGGKVNYAGVFEALHHCLKQRRNDVAQLLFEKIYPAYDPSGEEGKLKLEAIKEDLKAILATDNAQLLEDFKSEYLAKRVLLPPDYQKPTELPQSKEEE